MGTMMKELTMLKMVELGRLLGLAEDDEDAGESGEHAGSSLVDQGGPERRDQRILMGSPAGRWRRRTVVRKTTMSEQTMQKMVEEGVPLVSQGGLVRVDSRLGGQGG